MHNEERKKEKRDCTLCKGVAGCFRKLPVRENREQRTENRVQITE